MMTNLIETLYASKAHLAASSEKITQQLASDSRIKRGGLEAIHMYKQAITNVEEALDDYNDVPEVAGVLAYMVAKRRSIRTAPYYAPTKPALNTLAEEINTNLMECIEWLDYAHAAVAKQSCTTERMV